MTRRTIESAAEVLELEVRWQVNGGTTVVSILRVVVRAVERVWIAVAAAGELFVLVEQLIHSNSVILDAIRTGSIGRDPVVIGERILSCKISASLAA